jgi:hypothetical protein
MSKRRHFTTCDELLEDYILRMMRATPDWDPWPEWKLISFIAEERPGETTERIQAAIDGLLAQGRIRLSEPGAER